MSQFHLFIIDTFWYRRIPTTRFPSGRSTSRGSLYITRESLLSAYSSHISADLHQFVAGYVVGPIAWGPSSEIWGRRPIFLFPYIIYTLLQIANALIPAHQLGGLLVIRFFSGVMASVPINNAGALLADIWDGDRRGKAMSIFALAPFAGPSLGPIVSGYIQESGTVSLT